MKIKTFYLLLFVMFSIQLSAQDLEKIAQEIKEKAFSFTEVKWQVGMELMFLLKTIKKEII